MIMSLYAAVLLAALLLLLAPVSVVTQVCEAWVGASKEDSHLDGPGDECREHMPNNTFWDEYRAENRGLDGWAKLRIMGFELAGKVRAMVEAQKAKNPAGWTEAMEPPVYPGDGMGSLNTRMMRKTMWLKRVAQYLAEGRDMTDLEKDFERDQEKNQEEFDQMQKETWGPYREHAYQELLFEEAMDSWCGTFEGKNGGYRQGCGVYIKGMTFKEGCHVIETGQYAGVKYCRCIPYDCDQKDIEGFMAKWKKKSGGSRGGGAPIGGGHQGGGHYSGGGERGRGPVMWVVTSALAVKMARYVIVEPTY